MIRAVCFDPKLLCMDGLKKICRRMGGKPGGFLVDEGLVNCVESFPDGTVWLSFSRKDRRGVVDCRHDSSLFVQVNAYAAPHVEGGQV